jgi:hypothetical protein
MEQTNTFLKLIQQLICPEEIDQILQEVNYVDTARKFTVLELLHFWLFASCKEWKSFRDGEEQIKCYPQRAHVDHSTIAKKAADVPYEFFKKLFERLSKKMNRQTRRKTNLPLFAIDSTTITVGSNRLSWAPFRGEKSGIKVHVTFDVNDSLPIQAEDSDALEPDGLQLPLLTQRSSCVYIGDRGYASYKDFDAMQEKQQFFVIRLKKNAVFHVVHQKKIPDSSNLVEDIHAYIGSGNKETVNCFRIVSFVDSKGNLIQVATNLIDPDAQIIAHLYKKRWEIEIFFRWLKQNLNVKSFFGTTVDAVFGQVYSAFIAYFIIQFFYLHSCTNVGGLSLSRTTFFRKLLSGHLPAIWFVAVFSLLDRFRRNDL